MAQARILTSSRETRRPTQTDRGISGSQSQLALNLEYGGVSEASVKPVSLLPELLLSEVDRRSPLRLQDEPRQMPEDGPFVRPDVLDVVRLQDLVVTAPTQPDGGADTEAIGAGRADAVFGGLVVAGLGGQVQVGPGLAGHVGDVDVSRHAESDVRHVPVIPAK